MGYTSTKITFSCKKTLQPFLGNIRCGNVRDFWGTSWNAPSRHYPTIGLEHVPQACDWPTIKKRLCQIRQLSEAVLPHPMSFLGEFHPSNNGKYLDGYLFQAWNQPKPWCFEGPSSDLFRWEGRWCPKGSRSKNPGWSDDIQAEIADIIIL